MRGQFRVQRTLQNRLGQLLQKTVLPGYLFHRRTPLQQLIDQLPIQSHSISSQLVEKIVYTIWFTPSEEPPHLQGERSDSSAFLFHATKPSSSRPKPRTVSPSALQQTQKKAKGARLHRCTPKAALPNSSAVDRLQIRRSIPLAH